MKKLICSLTVLAMLLAMLLVMAGCNVDKDRFVVISREEGSGTRDAFVELFSILEKDAEGNKIDRTTIDAEITNSTSVMLASISGNRSAIGYVSMGSLNDSVKAVNIDGAQPTAANVKNGSYKIARPFNIAIKDQSNNAVNDFIKFILSTEGQQVVEQVGYIGQDTAQSYSSSKPTGKIVVAGSSSVTPVMEKLKEAYIKLNPKVSIEVHQSDSTSGMNSVLEGICDIGMASRALKESEISKGLNPTVIAMDGIAVIVNKNSPIDDLTSNQVKEIFTGQITNPNQLDFAKTEGLYE